MAVEAQRVLEAVAQRSGHSFAQTEIPCGGRYYLEHGRDWPEDAFEKCRAADLIMLGAVGWPSPDGPGPVTMDHGKMAGYSAVSGNRVNLDLYANMRPVKLFEGVQHKISGQAKQVWEPKDVDMVFFRENTEDLYCGLGGIMRKGTPQEVANQTMVATRHGVERCVSYAFETAKARKADGYRGHLT